jgi:tripartite-type tricarboxylate transporter receptor subunit TctC
MGAACLLPAQVLAQAAAPYPNKAIRMIVPVVPGGSTDVVGRIVGNKLREAFGESVVVDNRPGAGSIPGSDIVARALPDGYTLLFGYITHTTTPFLHSKVPYDAVKDFTPVSLVSTQPLVVVVNLSVPVNSVKELIALARAKPRQLNYGVAATGSAGHVAAEMFKLATGTEIVAVPYKGGAPVQVALQGGEVQVAFASTTSALTQIRSGKLKVLATTGAKRIPYLPEVPTIEEAAGLKGFEVSPWQGILAPARLPRPIVDRLHAEIVKMLKQPETVERLAATGTDPVGSTPEEFAAHIRRELEQFGKVIKASGMRGD